LAFEKYVLKCFLLYFQNVFLDFLKAFLKRHPTPLLPNNFQNTYFKKNFRNLISENLSCISMQKKSKTYSQPSLISKTKSATIYSHYRHRSLHHQQINYNAPLLSYKTVKDTIENFKSLLDAKLITLHCVLFTHIVLHTLFMHVSWVRP